METCICAYLPKAPVINTEIESVSLMSFEDETAEEIDTGRYDNMAQMDKMEKDDGSKSRDEHELKSSQISPLETGNDPIENDDAADVKISVSKTLVQETKSWITRKKLEQVELEVKCLQHDLHAQWSLRSQINANIQEIKAEKQKLTQEIQKSFTKHVNERNRLIQEIADIRQRLFYTTKSITLTESKNIELESERIDTAHCLSKSIAERRTVKCPNSENVEQNLSTTSTTESDENSSSCTESSESTSTNSTDLYPMITKGNNRNLSSVSTGTSTDLESESLEYNENVKSTPNDQKRSNISEEKINSIPDHMRLDLSFLENPNHIDSGFSEANNLASKNSFGDCSTASRIDDAIIFI